MAGRKEKIDDFMTKTSKAIYCNYKCVRLTEKLLYKTDSFVFYRLVGENFPEHPTDNLRDALLFK